MSKWKASTSLQEELAANATKVRVNNRSIVHGDLHISNVALDIKADGIPEAYIFDPGVVTRTVAGRDLALLEVSAILHQQLNLETVQKICSIIYSSPEPVTDDGASSLANPLARNAVEFIRELRKAAATWNDLYLYSLMVFDFALVQLGSLCLRFIRKQNMGSAFGATFADSRLKLAQNPLYWPIDNARK